MSLRPQGYQSYGPRQSQPLACQQHPRNFRNQNYPPSHTPGRGQHHNVRAPQYFNNQRSATPQRGTNPQAFNQKNIRFQNQGGVKRKSDCGQTCPAGVKRKSDGAPSGNNGPKVPMKANNGTQKQNENRNNNSFTNSDDGLASLLQPLYCAVCGVNLNAPSQAKQHYEGKGHLKKVKLYQQANQANGLNSVSTAVVQPSQLAERVNGSGPKLVDTPKMESKPEPATICSNETEKNSEVQPPQSTEASSSASQELNPEIYCKICEVSFNSPKQAEQHYQGKNHSKKLRATQAKSSPVTPEATPTNTKQGNKFICFMCNIHVTSQDQLDSHLNGAKHLTKLKMQERSQSALRGRWNKMPASTSALSNFPQISPPPSERFQNSNNGGFSPPMKRPKHRDFTNYRTPSGKYYCQACNCTMNSEAQFAQHVDSKRHKSNNAALRNSTESLES